MIRLTDATNGNEVVANPGYVVAIFVVAEGDYIGKTGISLINGTLIVEQSFDSVYSWVNTGIMAQRGV